MSREPVLYVKVGEMFGFVRNFQRQGISIIFLALVLSAT